MAFNVCHIENNLNPLFVLQIAKNLFTNIITATVQGTVTTATAPRLRVMPVNNSTKVYSAMVRMLYN